MSIQQRITDKLNAQISATHLDVINESFMHNVPKGAESHFKVIIVAEQFVGLSRLDRHRLINDILAQELQQHIHALSIHALTPQEWRDKQQAVADSPQCRGGSKK